MLKKFIKLFKILAKHFASTLVNFVTTTMHLKDMTWGGFHKPIYTLRQALTLCAELLRLKKLLKNSAQSVKWLCAQLLVFMKWTPSNCKVEQMGDIIFGPV